MVRAKPLVLLAKTPSLSAASKYQIKSSALLPRSQTVFSVGIFPVYLALDSKISLVLVLILGGRLHLVHGRVHKCRST